MREVPLLGLLCDRTVSSDYFFMCTQVASEGIVVPQKCETADHTGTFLFRNEASSSLPDLRPACALHSRPSESFKTMQSNAEDDEENTKFTTELLKEHTRAHASTWNVVEV